LSLQEVPPTAGVLVRVLVGVLVGVLVRFLVGVLVGVSVGVSVGTTVGVSELYWVTFVGVNVGNDVAAGVARQRHLSLFVHCPVLL